ncbi:hypothetical protein ACQ4PT_052573 [Festuca glaucescens]
MVLMLHIAPIPVTPFSPPPPLRRHRCPPPMPPPPPTNPTRRPSCWAAAPSARITSPPSPPSPTRTTRSGASRSRSREVATPANALTGAARLGLSPRIISKVANDALGRNILKELQDDGVDISFMTVAEEGNSPFTL